jgi:hypothetical protein
MMELQKKMGKKKAAGEGKPKARGRPKSRTGSDSEASQADIEMGMLNPEQRELMANNFKLPKAKAVGSSSSSSSNRGAAPAPSGEDMAEKIQYIGHIQAYHVRWPEDYGPFRPIDPTRVSLEQLVATFDEMRKLRNTKFGPMMARSSLGYLGKGIQFLWQAFGFGNPMLGPLAEMNLNGLGEVLASDSGYALFQEELDEIRILYPGLFSQPLWMRFTVKVATVVRQVAAANSGVPTPSTPVADAQRYADL